MTVKHALQSVTNRLCEPQSYQPLFHRSSHTVPMPSVEEVADIVEQLRSVLFPGYYGPASVAPETLPYYTGATLDAVLQKLSAQIARGNCFVCEHENNESCAECLDRATDTALAFFNELPSIRQALATDVQAAFHGDPAAKTPAETIFCYPSIKAVTNYRIAHALHQLDVDIIPRIITELAHASTGIDIHPGADIGHSFFIDHGTGTVIGETCIIGHNVRIYQGVTLGGKSFPQDENRQLIKGLPRHPIVQDDVVIYAGATILGRVTIGQGTVIGGNVWITEDVPAGVVLAQAQQDYRIKHTEQS